MLRIHRLDYGDEAIIQVISFDLGKMVSGQQDASGTRARRRDALPDVGGHRGGDLAGSAGHGVVPDIEVGLNREMLLKGIDSQLDSAIRYIEKEKQK